MSPIHILLVLGVVAVWGFNFVVIKVGLDEFPPLLLCAARFFLTSLPAIFFIKRPNVPFRQVALYGLIMFALQFALLFTGMYIGIAPGLASLMLQVNVFMSAILAYFIFGEKWTTGKIIGGLIAFSGIGLVACNLSGHVTGLGFTLVMAAAFFWSIGNVISKKMGKINMVALVIWASLVAWPPLLILSYFIEGPEKILYSLSHIKLLSVGAVFYLTYLSTLFGYGTWSYLVHHHPIQTISPFTLFIPIIGILSSVLVLGEPLQSWKVIAGVLVVTGVGLNLFWSRIFKKKDNPNLL